MQRGPCILHNSSISACIGKLQSNFYVLFFSLSTPTFSMCSKKKEKKKWLQSGHVFFENHVICLRGIQARLSLLPPVASHRGHSERWENTHHGTPWRPDGASEDWWGGEPAGAGVEKRRALRWQVQLRCRATAHGRRGQSWGIGPSVWTAQWRGCVQCQVAWRRFLTSIPKQSCSCLPRSSQILFFFFWTSTTASFVLIHSFIIHGFEIFLISEWKHAQLFI